MKKFILVLSILLGVFLHSAFCQEPGAINYQAVVRDISGNLVASQSVGFRLSILSGSPSGTVLYSETQVKTTTQFGTVVLEIGRGTVVSGNFSTIDWSSGTLYLQTEIDITGGTSYQLAGTSQFNFVPYSYYSKSSGNSLPAGTTGQTLYFNGTAWVPDGDLYSNGSRVGIGTGTPDNSAKLEVKSTSGGFLPPKMTKAQRDAISAPAEGLIVYCTDCGGGSTGTLSIYQNGIWSLIPVLCPPPEAPLEGINYSQPLYIIWKWTQAAGATGYKMNSSNNYFTATDLGLVTSKTETGLSCGTAYTRYLWAYNNCGVSAPVVLTDTTLIFYPNAPQWITPVISPTQITWKWNTVANAAGYKWNDTANYNTADDMGTATSYTETGLVKCTYYDRFIWAYSSCGGKSGMDVTNVRTTGSPPDAPTAGTHVPSPTQIVWNWNPSQGAVFYKWGTVNNYWTGTNVGTATTLTETGLSCNTNYTRYIWASDQCGYSATTILTQRTSLSPPAAPVAGTHVPSVTQIIWKWNKVTGATGYRWNTVNDSATAIHMGTDTSKTETGLTCNTAYTRYAWAQHACGVSASTALTQLTAPDPPAIPTEGTHVPSITQIIWNWNSVPAAAGYKWNTFNDLNSAMDMGTSTSKTETGLTCNTPYQRFMWSYNNCGVSNYGYMIKSTLVDPPPAPTAGTHVPSGTQIIWRWNPVSDAITYYFGTSNNFNSSNDIDNVTSLTETGLLCNTPYTRYIWVRTPCGTSSPGTLTQSTAMNPPGAPTEGTQVPSPTQIIWNWSTVPLANGYKWNTSDNYSTATDIGTLTTKTETGLTCQTIYTRYVWSYSNCGVSPSQAISAMTSSNPPASPAAGTHSPSPNQIIWRWNSVPQATGYRWNTVNDYYSATDMGTAMQKTETGLNCNTPYTRYVWAYGTCGASTPTILAQTTSMDPPVNPTSGTHVPSAIQIVWNWNPVGSATGYKWNTNNSYSAATDLGNTTTKTETGLTCNTSYTRYVWAYNSNCGNSSATTLTTMTTMNPPSAPTSGSHVPSTTQIVWNWNTTTLATGYKWNTTNNYNTATDLGNTTTKLETGLTCNTAYTRYVWAYNGTCGNSSTCILSSTTSMNPPAAPTAGTHTPGPTQIVWNWNPVSGATGYKWSATNNYSSATDLGNTTSKTETGLICNSAYTRYVWAYNGTCGNSSSTTLSQSTTACPFTCGGSLNDVRDGQLYGTAQIGTQCWMAKNLNYGTKINTAGNPSNNSLVEKYCYNNNDANCSEYGGLYTWDEMMNYTTTSNGNPSGRPGICPAGWHIPSDAEWCQLITFIDGTVNCNTIGFTGNNAGGKMKETGTIHWLAPNTGADNTSGFTGLPGGVVQSGGAFSDLNNWGYFWSATEYSASQGYDYDLYYNDARVIRDYYSKTNAFSVRCVKD